MIESVKHDKPVTPAEDNKLIDFVAALMPGLGMMLIVGIGWLLIVGIGWDSFSVPDDEPPDSFSIGILIGFLAYSLFFIGSYAIAALLLFLWKARFRVQFGWILIALLGSVFAAMVPSVLGLFLFDRLYPEDPSLKFHMQVMAVSMLPIKVLMSTALTLPVMAAVHYLGLALRKRRRRVS